MTSDELAEMNGRLKVVYEMKALWQGKLRPGDCYRVDADGKNWLVWPEDVVKTLKSGERVFMSVGDGKCREFGLIKETK